MRARSAATVGWQRQKNETDLQRGDERQSLGIFPRWYLDLLPFRYQVTFLPWILLDTGLARAGFSLFIFIKVGPIVSSFKIEPQLL